MKRLFFLLFFFPFSFALSVSLIHDFPNSIASGSEATAEYSFTSNIAGNYEIVITSNTSEAIKVNSQAICPENPIGVFTCQNNMVAGENRPILNISISPYYAGNININTVKFNVQQEVSQPLASSGNSGGGFFLIPKTTPTIISNQTPIEQPKPEELPKNLTLLKPEIIINQTNIATQKNESEKEVGTTIIDLSYVPKVNEEDKGIIIIAGIILFAIVLVMIWIMRSKKDAEE